MTAAQFRKALARNGIEFGYRRFGATYYRVAPGFHVAAPVGCSQSKVLAYLLERKASEEAKRGVK